MPRRGADLQDQSLERKVLMTLATDTTEPAEPQQRDVLDPATAEERAALADHLWAMANAVADGDLPVDSSTHAEIMYHVHVKDFASREDALAAFDALAAQFGVEVVHSEDRHLVTRTWGTTYGSRAEYKAILWESPDDEATEESAVDAAATAVDEPALVEPVEDPEPVTADTQDDDTVRRLARVASAVGGLVRLRDGGHLRNLRAGQHIDAITAALDGHASPSAMVELDDDTVYVSDGVVTSTFSISEAYTVLHALVDGLPNARRSLGLEVGAR
jgi:hypothetical protein